MTSLYALKPWYTRRLEPVLDTSARAGLSPDFFTALGVVAAALAATAIAAGCWVGAATLLALRLAGANLDGALARRQNSARPWGFVLNEVGDRASDLLMFAGLAVLAVRTGGYGPQLWLVAGAAVAAGLPTFVSLALAGAGARPHAGEPSLRLNGGPLGKTERCLVAVLAAAFPIGLAWFAVVLIAGSLLTAGVRLRRGWLLLASRRDQPAGVAVGRRS